MLGVASYSAMISVKMQIILVDLGDVALPGITQMFFRIPSLLYLSIGAVVGCMLAWSIWKTSHVWQPVLITTVTAIFLFLYLGVFSMAMLKPIGGLIISLEKGPEGTNKSQEGIGEELAKPSE